MLIPDYKLPLNKTLKKDKLIPKFFHTYKKVFTWGNVNFLFETGVITLGYTHYAYIAILDVMLYCV